MAKNSTLSVSEVAKMLRISTDAVYEAVARGDLSSFRVGRRIFISSDGFTRLIDGKVK